MRHAAPQRPGHDRGHAAARVWAEKPPTEPERETRELKGKAARERQATSRAVPVRQAPPPRADVIGARCHWPAGRKGRLNASGWAGGSGSEGGRRRKTRGGAARARRRGVRAHEAEWPPSGGGGGARGGWLARRAGCCAPALAFFFPLQRLVEEAEAVQEAFPLPLSATCPGPLSAAAWSLGPGLSRPRVSGRKGKEGREGGR